MKQRGSRKTWLLVLLLVLGVLLVAGTFLGIRALQRPPLRERFQLIAVGMPESEVREILGNPRSEGRNIRAGELILSYKEGNTYFVVAIQDGQVIRYDSGESR